MEFRNTIVCKGVEYQTNIKAVSDQLTILITDFNSSSTWHGAFNSKSIEDLTSKTGNTKTFTVFCKLLVAALQAKNPSLHIDFYSYQDLETIRNGISSLLISTKPSKKKYLIISYITDFEKVHYPLPLILQDPKVDKNYEISKPGPDLLSENLKLKQENSMLVKNLNTFKDDFLSYREKTERKIDELSSDKLELEAEIHRMKEELDVIIEQLEEEAKKRSNAENHGFKSLNNALAIEKEEKNTLKKELENSYKEIEALKASNFAYKKRLDTLKKKLDSKEDKGIDSPISSDSPHQSPLKLSISDSANIKNHLSEYNDFTNHINKIKRLIDKSKS